MSHPPSRFKINSKPKPENATPPNKSLSPDLKKDYNLRNKPKSSSDARLMGRSASSSEQFSRPRRAGFVDTSKELQEKEGLIKELQSQVVSLKAELDNAHSLNRKLDSHNKKLAQDLAKLAVFNAPHQELQSQKFEKLEGLMVKTPCSPPPPPPMHFFPKPAPSQTEIQSNPSMPPPPPPPMRPVARATSAPKTPSIVELYRSLTKHGDKIDIQGPGNHYKSTATSVHNSIVGEIQNRSAHLLAIKADVETKGDFINGLIQKVVAFAYTDIEDVLKFVDWLDDELSTLADERAVLKHFNWPERKADAIREAAIEYRGLKKLEREITSFKDDSNIPHGMALKKMALLLDKLEKRIGGLIKLRSSALRTYQDWKIPTSWMLDSGIVSKVKESSMKLAKMYIKRVKMALEVGRNLDRECNQEALVLQGVQFAYRAHQFAGGLDSETLCAFEEIRQRVPTQLGAGVTSQELLPAVPAS